MSLSRLPLPSNGGILEGHVDTAAKRESEDGNENLSKVSDSQAPEPAVPAIVVAQTHLMKTIDFRGNDLESEEVELFSLKVGFPDEPAVEGDNIVNVVEARPPDVAHVANRQEGEEERVPNRWLNIDFSQWMMAIRRLFPFRLAEVLLRKAGRELAQRFAQR